LPLSWRAVDVPARAAKDTMSAKKAATEERRNDVKCDILRAENDDDEATNAVALSVLAFRAVTRFSGDLGLSLEDVRLWREGACRALLSRVSIDLAASFFETPVYPGPQ